MLSPTVRNILSVDVEEHFQVEAFRPIVSSTQWESFESRVERNTRKAFEIFARHHVTATFFFVGWVAERHPSLVKEAAQLGHEIGCHSFWHRTIFSLTPAEFREDTRQAKQLLEDISGQRVTGYRAPSWSITKQSMWALEILAEEGFEYDSSIYPIHHDIYGIPGADRYRFWHQLLSGRRLLEIPPTTLQIGRVRMPAAGGGYLRLFPLWYNRIAIDRCEQADQPAIIYLHPWELDPEQPRIADAGLRSRFRHYTNLKRMQPRLEQLLRNGRFTSFREWLGQDMQPVSAQEAYAGSTH